MRLQRSSLYYLPTTLPTVRSTKLKSKYEDEEEDKIKLVGCGQVEAEVREGKADVKYVKNGEEGWTPVVFIFIFYFYFF